MKLLPQLLVGFVVAVVVAMLLLYLWEGGENFEWKSNLFTSIAGGAGAMGGLYFFGKKKEK